MNVLFYNKNGEIIKSGKPSGEYISRYYAKKQAGKTEVVVKWNDGYRILSYKEYKEFLKKGKK